MAGSTENTPVKEPMECPDQAGDAGDQDDGESPESPRPLPMHFRGDHTYGAVSSQSSENLPTGWTRKITQRSNGVSAGRFDVYIYSPEGKKFRSKPELAAHFAMKKMDFNVKDFDFSAYGKGSPIKGSPVQKARAANQHNSKRKVKKTVKDKKIAKTVPQKLVVKMKFSTPPKSRVRRKSASSSEKKGRKSSLKRSISESAVVKGKGKTVYNLEKKPSPIKRSISVGVEKTSTVKNLSTRQRRKSKADNSSPLKYKAEKSVESESPLGQTQSETNNNDIHWTGSPQSVHKESKRKSSSGSPDSKSANTTPGKLGRVLSDNTARSPRDRSPRIHRSSSTSVQGEDYALSKRRKLSAN